MKRSPLQRRTPLRPIRATPRRGQPTREEKGQVRLLVYRRDGGQCVDCSKPVIWRRGYWNSMHLMHIRSRGAGGSWDPENLLTGCPECHMKRHNCGGKPLPRKESHGN